MKNLSLMHRKCSFYLIETIYGKVDFPIARAAESRVIGPCADRVCDKGEFLRNSRIFLTLEINMVKTLKIASLR